MNFVLLNLYPYTTGHLMIAPYEHVATLEEASPETAGGNDALARIASKAPPRSLSAARSEPRHELGECAGAGVAGHIHMHVLPRWPGDSNFMTTVGETRVLPEDISITYKKLSEAFRRT